MISQSKAIKLAVQALAERRRRFYVAGEAAYQKGLDFEFAINGHKHYMEHTEAIRQLEDLAACASENEKGVSK